eukprot:CAMPEP_0172302328 /NCGR_PEP_ID=MMETSP1058-20130122/4042_1 /TAXON_ID=83371 /ORGANISM="Detonula confervacea, Strain CCMP 353" /LENGTH=124 /DNA_ID=CAMNT_0013012753 /DNA_START=88 /DNA_END=462 /DNA_ORIENTATION=-
MSKRRPKEDAMILIAVKLYNASTVSTVRQSLLGAEFTKKESDDKARQMKVRRRVIKRNASNGSTATRAPTAVDAVSPASAVSSITVTPPAPKFPPPICSSKDEYPSPPRQCDVVQRTRRRVDRT